VVKDIRSKLFFLVSVPFDLAQAEILEALSLF
jgi:hypothetical protein